MTDNDRLGSIKMDPLVNRTQLYGQPSLHEISRVFTRGYVENLIPALSSIGSRGAGRERYVFAIEPRREKDGTRAVQPRQVEDVRVELDAEGYIGNIAIEITDPVKELAPQGGAPVIYPTVEELAASKTHASTSYIRSLMSETIRALFPFIFRTLRLPHIIIDPLLTNDASILLAVKLGFTRVGEREAEGGRSWGKGGQALFRLTREEWEREQGRKKAKAARKKKNKKAKGADAAAREQEMEGLTVTIDGEEGDEARQQEERKAANPEETALQTVMAQKGICRWCQVPSNVAQLGCSGCDWAFWCSQPCKTADLTYRDGHALQCAGRGGDPEHISHGSLLSALSGLI
ncbi:hypothetical protein JCM10450v2_004001 [Rhodotorula kratochvilovae]